MGGILKRRRRRRRRSRWSEAGVSSGRVENLACDIALQHVSQNGECDGFLMCGHVNEYKQGRRLRGKCFTYWAVATLRTVAFLHLAKLQHSECRTGSSSPDYCRLHLNYFSYISIGRCCIGSHPTSSTPISIAIIIMSAKYEPPGICWLVYPTTITLFIFAMTGRLKFTPGRVISTCALLHGFWFGWWGLHHYLRIKEIAVLRAQIVKIEENIRLRRLGIERLEEEALAREQEQD